jgi:hypothetical protein
LFRRLVAEQRADAQRPVTLLEKIQVLDLVDIDQVARAGEPQLQQRDQALAARQDLGVFTELIEEAERLVHGPRSVVLKRSRQHDQPSFLWARVTG